MSTGLIYSPHFHDHDTGPSLPERPARLSAVVKQLRDSGLWRHLHHLDFSPAERDALHRLHEPDYVQRVFEAAARGGGYLDSPDCPLSPATAEIACLASGGAIHAVEAVLAGQLTNAFCAMRPPGHHAERDHAMGFCFFNHVALAAEHLIAQHGLKRVAIVDFDVHHGNGTQHLFEHRPDVLFISIHQDPRTLFPGTGLASESGIGPGQGFTLNLPLPAHSGDEAYLQTIDQQVLPRLEAYQPQFLLISAGFDAAPDDPLGNMLLTTTGFEQMTSRLADAADRLCHGRLVSVLEGGYDLSSLAESAACHLTVLLKHAQARPA